MSNPRVLGPVLNTAAVERVARDLLSQERGLLRIYLDEVVRQDTPGMPTSEIDRLQLPKTVKVREEARHFADDQLPAIILVSPGTSEQPRRDGAGVYEIKMPLAVTAIVKKGTEDLAREIAGIHAAAAAAVLLQCLPRVDDRVTSVIWDGFLTTDTPDSTARTLHVCVHQLTLTVRDAMNDMGLPGFPPDFAPGDSSIVNPGEYGLVQEATVTIGKIGDEDD